MGTFSDNRNAQGVMLEPHCASFARSLEAWLLLLLLVVVVLAERIELPESV